MGYNVSRSGLDKSRNKNAPQKANPIGMILVFITLGASIAFGWWLFQPLQASFVRQYLTFASNWPDWVIAVLGGVVALILLQFLVVLLSGILFPLPPQDEYDEDGMYKRKYP